MRADIRSKFFQNHLYQNASRLAAQYNTELIEIFTREPDQINVPEALSGDTPLILACTYGEHYVPLALWLIAHRSTNFNQTNNMQSNALIIAIRRDLIAVVRALIQKQQELQVNQVETRSGNNALILACMDIRRTEFALLLLLREDIIVDHANLERRTALHYAVNSDALRVVERLFEKRVEINPDGPDGTPLQMACRSNHTEVARALLARPEIDVNTGSPLNWAVLNNLLHVVRDFVTKPELTVNSIGALEVTPLTMACQLGFSEIALALLTRQDVAVNHIGRSNYTALFFASHRGMTDVVRALLTRQNIVVNTPDHNGKTPLMAACAGRHSDIVLMLLQRPEIHVWYEQNISGTALSHAINNNLLPIVEQILMWYLRRHLPLTAYDSALLEKQWSRSPLYQPSTCKYCQLQFKTLNPRHHCRGCAGAVCGKCSVVIPVVWQNNKHIRYCRLCVDVALMQSAPILILPPNLVIASQNAILTLEQIPSQIILGVTVDAYQPMKMDLTFLNQLAFLRSRTLTQPIRRHDSEQDQKIRNKIAGLIPDGLKKEIGRMILFDTDDVNVAPYPNFPSFLVDNLLFLSSDETLGLGVTYNYFAKFMHNDERGASDIQWSHIYVFKLNANFEYEAVELRNLIDLFKQFPIFELKYKAQQKEQLEAYVSTIFQTDKNLKKHVLAAMNSGAYEEKFVDAARQRAFERCLDPLFDASTRFANIRFTPAALEHMFRLFQYTGESQHNKNLLCLCLAFVFTKLSSANFFGTESESPIAIRKCAGAFLNAISGDDPAITTAQVNTWKGKLFHLEGAFDCTNALSNELRMGLRNISGGADALGRICPVVWL